jgi:hypothetical protein
MCELSIILVRKLVSVSSPDLVLFFTVGVNVHSIAESVVVFVLSDIVATVVVNPSPKSVWHIIFELTFVDPVVILSPSSDSTSLAILIYLAFVLVWKSIVSEAVSDF